MAKVKFGMMMTDASGKLGGQVFSKNRSGSYVRTKVTPSNPQTLAQQASRATLAAVSSAWSDLTDIQRASFNNAVEDWKKTDIFGDLKKPTGKNLFSALNINLINTGQAQITVAPPKVEIPYFGLTSVEGDVSDAEILLVASSAPAGFVVLISATPPQSAGTSFFKGKYRDLTFQPSATASAYDLYADYAAKFGAPLAGANVSFRIKLIAPNGQAGVPETAKLVMSA